MGNLYRGLRAIIANPAALAGLIVVTLLVLMAIFAGVLAGGAGEGTHVLDEAQHRHPGLAKHTHAAAHILDGQGRRGGDDGRRRQRLELDVRIDK